MTRRSEGAATLPTAALEPVRDPQATVTDLLEVLLDKGVVLNLDLLISVADIPLIGVSVKAALAGIETMLEFGMMRGWDAQTRAWVQRSLTRHVPLAAGETLLLRMIGSCFAPEPLPMWRPGTVYLTDRRVLVFRRDPPEVLLSEWHQNVQRVRLVRAGTGGDADRLEIRLVRKDGTEARLTAENPHRLARRIRAHTLDGPTRATLATGPFMQGELWYEEPRAIGSVWRSGHGVLDAENGLRWRSPLDGRPAVSLTRAHVKALRTEERDTPVKRRALIVETDGGELAFAGARLERWLKALRQWRRDQGGLDGNLR